jgi:hypothetical protein
MRLVLLALVTSFSFAAAAQQASEIITAKKIVGFDLSKGSVQHGEIALQGELCGTSPGMICRAMEFKGVTVELANGERKTYPSFILVNENLSRDGGGLGMIMGPAGFFEFGIAVRDVIKTDDPEYKETMSMLEEAGMRLDMEKMSDIQLVNTKKEFIAFDAGEERGDTVVARLNTLSFIEPKGTVKSKNDIAPNSPDVNDVNVTDPKTGKTAHFIQMDTKFSYEVNLEQLKAEANTRLARKH